MTKPVIMHKEIGYKFDWDAVDEYERQKKEKETQIQVDYVDNFDQE